MRPHHGSKGDQQNNVLYNQMNKANYIQVLAPTVAKKPARLPANSVFLSRFFTTFIPKFSEEIALKMQLTWTFFNFVNFQGKNNKLKTCT